jgi:hypothetical protein
MACSKLLLAVSAILFAVTAGAHEATARQRAVTRADWSGAPDPGLAPRDFCGGRLPGYGVDACGYPEVGYGMANSCWQRVRATPKHPEPRLVSICG